MGVQCHPQPPALLTPTHDWHQAKKPPTLGFNDVVRPANFGHICPGQHKITCSQLPRGRRQAVVCPQNFGLMLADFGIPWFLDGVTLMKED